LKESRRSCRRWTHIPVPSPSSPYLEPQCLLLAPTALSQQRSGLQCRLNSREPTRSAQLENGNEKIRYSWSSLTSSDPRCSSSGSLTLSIWSISAPRSSKSPTRSAAPSIEARPKAVRPFYSYTEAHRWVRSVSARNEQHGDRNEQLTPLRSPTSSSRSTEAPRSNNSRAISRCLSATARHRGLLPALGYTGRVLERDEERGKRYSLCL